LKYVGRRFGVGSADSASVAKDREVVEDAQMNERDAWRRGGAFRHLKRVAVAAIVGIVRVEVRKLRISTICYDAWKSETESRKEAPR
jgi:hypothetical protein